jgi:hypothetical protein
VIIRHLLRGDVADGMISMTKEFDLNPPRKDDVGMIARVCLGHRRDAPGPPFDGRDAVVAQDLLKSGNRSQDLPVADRICPSMRGSIVKEFERRRKLWPSRMSARSS